MEIYYLLASNKHLRGLIPLYSISFFPCKVSPTESQHFLIDFLNAVDWTTCCNELQLFRPQDDSLTGWFTHNQDCSPTHLMGKIPSKFSWQNLPATFQLAFRRYLIFYPNVVIYPLSVERKKKYVCLYFDGYRSLKEVCANHLKRGRNLLIVGKSPCRRIVLWAKRPAVPDTAITF